MNEYTDLQPGLADKPIYWIELAIFLTDTNFLDLPRLQNWISNFAKVTVMAPTPKGKRIPAGVIWKQYGKGECRTELWNRHVADADGGWLLFLEDDEDIRFSDFPTLDTISQKRWAPALVLCNKEGRTHQYYQMRLVPAWAEKPFGGKNLPDCTRYITKNEISLLTQPILIERKTDPVSKIDADEELSVSDFSPQLYLVKGEQFFRRGKYVHAAAQYRALLKQEKLLPFDRLGAVNGLTSCLVEQNKWAEAIALANTSIEAEPLQRLPYLIQFKIFQLQKKWDEAFTILNSYYQMLSLYSLANYDKAIGEQQTLLELAELALKGGRKEKALDFFSAYFTLKEGKVDQDFSHKLLLLSIEVGDYERSVGYFNHMFEQPLSSQSFEQQHSMLDEYMSLFIKKGWYDFVSEVYQQLHSASPQNGDYKRRLIVAYSKMNKLDKARRLIGA